MDRAAFDSLQAAIMRDALPSSGDDLLGMEMDFTAHLCGLDVLVDADVHRTDDPARLIVAVAEATSVSTPEQIADALVEVWQTKLRYPHREGHVVTVDAASVRLEAITQIAPDGFYVTAQVTAHIGAR